MLSRGNLPGGESYYHSTPRAPTHGKRGAVPGGRKENRIVLPDADREMTTRIVADSAFGCAGRAWSAASLSRYWWARAPGLRTPIQTRKQPAKVETGCIPKADDQ